jgi:hydrogenase-4 component C
VPTFTQLLVAFLQIALVAVAAPFVSGFSRVLRAKMHTRRGPGLFQDWRDLRKLLTRQDVRPPAAGFVFRIMPIVFPATLLVIAAGTPILTRAAPVPALGDLITIVYLYALARFFFALSGLDSGSSFAGVGASRELTLGVLIEPVMILSLFVAALLAGSTDLGEIGSAIAEGRSTSIAATVLAATAFAFTCYVELGKLPYDMAEAEQELQEGPLTEYAGPSLALVKWSLWLKQVVVVSWFCALFVPFGAATEISFFGIFVGLLAWAAKLAVIFLVVGVVENSVARARFRLTPRHSWLGVGIASLAFVFYLAGL